MQQDLPPLIQALLNPTLYSHPVEGFEVLQTHLSWVILTGSYAYKIKKPLSFGFQDFTTLEKRQYYCALELMLNQAYTQGIYEEVLPITGTPEEPLLEGEGPVIEYAIRMRQFPQEALLSAKIASGELSGDLIEQLARQTAAFHLSTQTCSEDAIYGTPEQAYAPVKENFEVIASFLTSPEDQALLEKARLGAQADYSQLHEVIAARKADGFTRACHGDMHLANAVLIDNQATFFDCIEFNEAFRWTDVMADVGFITMDLEVYQRPDLSNLFLNTYLECTGDYEGARVLPFYQAYRAMVRAKIAVLQSSQTQDETEKNTFLATFRQYTTLAIHYMQPKSLSLAMTHGFSGCGKTTYSGEQMLKMGAIRIRSDVERKRLAGLPVHLPSPPASRPALYSHEMTEKTFDTLTTLADTLLTAGWPVIIDAASLLFSQRQAFHGVAQRHHCPFVIWHLEAPEAELRARLAQRPPEASDATADIVRKQAEVAEPFREEELSYVQDVSRALA